jgi:hypothetical protein
MWRISQCLVSVWAGMSLLSTAAPLMSGGPYAIASDVALAGSNPMAAGNYRVIATVGEAATAGSVTASGFRVFAGFWQGERFIAPCLLDIDGNGFIEPAFDGVLIARALSGMRGQALVDGAIGAGALYTEPDQILARINFDAMDVDGDRTVLATTDGFIILRAMLGIRSDSIVVGAVAPSATRGSWALIRNYLNNACGATFTP